MTWYYMPSTSAPATEVSSSASDTPAWNAEPWVTLSGTATQRPSSWSGWSRRGWISLLSGLTSTRSTLNRGLAEWSSSLPVSRVSRSPLPDNERVLTMTGGSGLPSDGSSVTWDRATCSWRTSPDLFGPGSLTSSPTLPTSGSMRNGVCSQRPQLVPLTAADESGFSLWPTTTTMDSRSSGGNPNTTGSHGPELQGQARMWPTPCARDGKGLPGPQAQMDTLPAAVSRHDQPTTTDGTEGGGMRSGARSGEPKLQGRARMWPTPRAHDGMTTCDKASSHPKSGGDGLITAASRHAQTTTPDGNDGPPKADLNPRFVAALMGVPWDWLTLSISGGTDSSRSAQQKRSDSSTSGA